jgi:5-methylcytosine-specific restriction endonuclease McrA
MFISFGPVQRKQSAEERLVKQRDYGRRYRAKNAEIIRARRQLRHRQNREVELDQQREYRRRNRERLNAQSREYAAAHREEARQRARAWYQAHRSDDLLARERQRHRDMYKNDPRRREYLRSWKDANRAKHNEYVHVSRARRNATAGRGVSVAEWHDLIKAYGGRCAYCYADRPLTMDHRVPLARGGSHEIENILPACKPCNSRKHTMTEAEFRVLLAREREREIKESRPVYASQLR